MSDGAHHPYHPDDASFIRYLRRSRDEYVRAADRWLRFMWGCQCITVLATVVAGTAAASITPVNASCTKWLSVGASVLAATALTIAREFRVQEMTTLRDDGRRKMDDIFTFALNIFLQNREKPEERFKARELVREKILELEAEQGLQWMALHRRGGSKAE